MPWSDWQFYVVTMAAVWGAWMLLRQFLPRDGAGSACGACASGAAACVKKPQLATDDTLVVLSDRRLSSSR
jgi:hypothetical protein